MSRSVVVVVEPCCLPDGLVVPPFYCWEILQPRMQMETIGPSWPVGIERIVAMIGHTDWLACMCPALGIAHSSGKRSKGWCQLKKKFQRAVAVSVPRVVGLTGAKGLTNTRRTSALMLGCPNKKNFKIYILN